MKSGKIGGLTNKLAEIPRRLKKFITHDVRHNPILGLYLVIGVMAIGYGIYFVGVLYKDVTSPADKRIASKPKVERLNKTQPGPKPPPSKKKKTVVAPTKKSPEQVAPAKPEPGTKKVAAKPKSVGAEKLPTSNWQKFEFKDGSRIFFPPDWSRSEISPENNIIHGIRLQAPGTKASLKCYGRARQPGMDIAKSLKKTMSNGGYSKIKEEKSEINNLDVVQLSGMLADKHMVVSIFDDQPGKYFVVSLVASERDYEKLQTYYGTIVDSYEGAKKSAVSITKIEQELEKSIKKEEEYLVGTTIRIKLKNGARHQGVVIAEDDDSLTLESFRFGGKYSFTVKKKDIVKLFR
jgi:hypothetical protein